jgi:ubiquinone/menaquinone biosynthesis C-methylase UbiE
MQNPQRKNSNKLKLLPRDQYIDMEEYDPLRFYYWPILGTLFRQRVELCLAECKGGDKVLDVGFGSGINFLNLNGMYREIYGLDLQSDVDLVTEGFKKIGIRTQLRNGNVLNLPYPDNSFDTVLLVSVLEHIKPEEQELAFDEITRVLKPGGQVVYGVPVDHPLIEFAFYLLNSNIRDHHFSSEKDVYHAAQRVLEKVKLIEMKPSLPIIRAIYQVGHFIKKGENNKEK